MRVCASTDKYANSLM